MMASNVYTCCTVTGPVRMRRTIKQGRKPSGLAKPQLIRLYADDKAMLDTVSDKMGHLWNCNEFIRFAVHEALQRSVYIELIKH